jgi:ABC-type nitrate/sulfonate/bicarbonate transport system substrate-binding protein
LFFGDPFPSNSSETAKPFQLKLRFGIPTGTIVYSTYSLAKEMGFYRDEGLEIELIHVPAVTGLQALLSGDLQFVGAGTTPINAALRGARLKTVFVAVDKPEFDLYVGPQIRSFVDLKGKTVVVSGIGTLTDRLLRELLQLNGVNPKDVVVRGMVSADLRYQSLVQGIVDGSLLAPPLNFRAEKDGFKKLAFLGDYLQATSASVTITDDFRHLNPDVVFRFVRASLRGLDFYKQNRDMTMRHIEKFLNIKDKELSEKSYNFHLAALTRNGVITDELMKRTIDDSLQAMKAVKEVSTAHLFDFSFATKAAAERTIRK